MSRWIVIGMKNLQVGLWMSVDVARGKIRPKRGTFVGG